MKRDVINKKFSLLTVIDELDSVGYNRVVVAVCDCGRKKTVRLSNLQSGNTKSCGCIRSPAMTKHGLSNHPLYAIWNDMKMRCYNKNRPSFKNYGGRGVRVCDEWRNNPECFILWAIGAGWKMGLELDKDKIGDGLLYSPKTCCFITPLENSCFRRNNRLVYYNGEKMTISSLSRMVGIPYSKLFYRINNSNDKVESIVDSIGKEKFK